MANNPLSRSKKKRVWEKTSGVCWYCGDALDFDEFFHPDHVIPRSKGGTNDISNLVPCCPPCNYKKHARTIDEFRELMSRKPEYIRFSQRQKQWIWDMCNIDINTYLYSESSHVFWFERNR